MENTTHEIDKSTWGPGPWQTEPDRLEWRHKGMPCLIVRVDSHGALCGYVAVPPGHPCYGQTYGEGAVDDLRVHGGITYGNKCAGHICHVAQPGEPDDVWWLGFDHAHSGDLCPGYARSRFQMRSTYRESYEEYRDLAYVKAEVESLAEQLIAVA